MSPPQTGQRGDAVFNQYVASLAKLPFNKHQRQAVAQAAVGGLLEHTGRAILIGEGSGATVAWLAADQKASLVASVVTLEPDGPPFGTTRTTVQGVRYYTSSVRRDTAIRAHGVADIPLTYDPPLGGPQADSSGKLHLKPRVMGGGRCMLQCRVGEVDEDERVAEAVHRLANLCCMSHAIITAHASFHVQIDWATVAFLQQAGVDIHHLRLADYGVFGNGNLIFLEQNSDRVARLVYLWLEKHGGKALMPNLLC